MMLFSLFGGILFSIFIAIHQMLINTYVMADSASAKSGINESG